MGCIPRALLIAAALALALSGCGKRLELTIDFAIEPGQVKAESVHRGGRELGDVEGTEKGSRPKTTRVKVSLDDVAVTRDSRFILCGARIYIESDERTRQPYESGMNVPLPLTVAYPNGGQEPVRHLRIEIKKSHDGPLPVTRGERIGTATKLPTGDLWQIEFDQPQRIAVRSAFLDRNDELRLLTPKTTDCLYGEDDLVGEAR